MHCFGIECNASKETLKASLAWFILLWLSAVGGADRQRVIWRRGGVCNSRSKHSHASSSVTVTTTATCTRHHLSRRSLSRPRYHDAAITTGRPILLINPYTIALQWLRCGHCYHRGVGEGRPHGPANTGGGGGGGGDRASAFPLYGQRDDDDVLLQLTGTWWKGQSL